MNACMRSVAVCVAAAGSLEEMLSRLSSRTWHPTALLTEGRYNEIASILSGNFTTHKEYLSLRAKYEHDTLNGVTTLFLWRNAHAKKAVSGRHVAKKKKLDAAAAVATEEAPDTSSSDDDSEAKEEEGDKRSGIPCLSTAAAIAGATGMGIEMPQQARLVRKMLPRISNIRNILHDAHGATAHPGVERLYKRIRDTVEGVTRDLCAAFVRQCPGCAALKLPSKPRPLVVALQTLRFAQLMQLDCMSFVDLRSGSPVTYVVLHVQCHFTKWSELVLIPNKEQETVAITLWRIFLRIGSPEVLQSDNGGEFVNVCVDKLLDAMTTAAGTPIRFIHGRPYHPASQGSVERGNGVLRSCLQQLCAVSEHEEIEFSDLLAMAQWNMNTHYHRSIGQSSYQLVYNRVPPASMGMCRISLDHSMHIAEAEPPAAAEGQLSQASQSQSPGSHCAAAATAAATVAHADNSNAGRINTARYKASWLALINKKRWDETYQCGELAWLQLERSGHHSSIAKKLPVQLCIIISVHSHSMYSVFTVHGLLESHFHACMLAKTPVGLQRPHELGVQPMDVLAEYSAENRTLLSTNALCNIISPPSSKPDEYHANFVATAAANKHQSATVKLIVSRKRK